MKPDKARTLAEFRAYFSTYIAEMARTGYTGRVDISLHFIQGGLRSASVMEERRRFPLSTKPGATDASGS